MKPIFAAVAVALCAGCAGEPQTLGATATMITVCRAPAGGWQAALDHAEAHCAATGRRAVLIQDTLGRCSLGSGIMAGFVTHFRCVSD